MLMISNVIMGALIVFVLLNFFTKLLAEKVFKKVLPPWTKTAITTVSRDAQGRHQQKKGGRMLLLGV